ncbi:hypothetical protein ACES2L_01950 [Bdellovibrio bacteriovorus]|uniref:Uncharacterized protein n=1 Tax=Bdellovibrio reynosensis TaxID=2835041 RepID=A0ABY4C4Y2_9BACT|nr:hypothetical protein [Bdellovibrio reynosensis]UOF00021.1 hypothetical protein MNR06_09940 [Bdellovibrio reynosensis]
MTFAKIITAAMIALTASTSFATTKCDHKGNGGLFANTNPTKATYAVKTDKQVVKAGVR